MLRTTASRRAYSGIWQNTQKHVLSLVAGANEGHTAGVVALAIGQSAAEGPLKDYVISAGRDGFMGVFQTEDGKCKYKHKCGEGMSSLAVFHPRPRQSALLLVGYEVRGRSLRSLLVGDGLFASLSSSYTRHLNLSQALNRSRLFAVPLMIFSEYCPPRAVLLRCSRDENEFVGRTDAKVRVVWPRGRHA